MLQGINGVTSEIKNNEERRKKRKKGSLVVLPKGWFKVAQRSDQRWVPGEKKKIY